MNQELRFTDTNSADDSQGRTWGLEGNLFWFLAVGAFSFVVILLVLFSVFHLALMTSVGIGAVPLGLCLIYIFALRHGKPAGYDVDCLDLWLTGPGFAPNQDSKIKHPLDHV